jgi:hypothetical protein
MIGGSKEELTYAKGYGGAGRPLALIQWLFPSQVAPEKVAMHEISHRFTSFVPFHLPTLFGGDTINTHLLCGRQHSNEEAPAPAMEW